MTPRYMPSWAEHILDALLASRVVQADQLAGLSSPALQEVATSYVRASAAGEAFDAEQAIGSARARTRDQRNWERRTAA